MAATLPPVAPAIATSYTATLQEIRSRANAFVSEWTGESRERAEKDSFWNEFFEIFGVRRRRVATFEHVARRYSTSNTGFMDLLMQGQMAVEHKSGGGNLDTAMGQLLDYISGGSLRDSDLPHTLVVCNFRRFLVHDVDSGVSEQFDLKDLPKHIERFSFIAGYGRRDVHQTEEEANLTATQLLADLHDALKDTRYPAHDMRVFLTRILYVLFADDTQLWEKNLFWDYIEVSTKADGSDTGRVLAELFEVLNTPPHMRVTNLDPTLREFAYVNGGLFAERLRTPSFDAEMRNRLLAACSFEWSRLSPAIFGSLFQDVMEASERRRLGAHYTTEQNILRTIRPLFLDRLEARVAKALAGQDRSERLRRLRELRDELPTLKFFDPACGCGNFLVVAYRELRRLELQVLLAIRENEAGSVRRGRAGHGQLAVDITLVSRVTVDQFYGIEIEEFPARIAETAMHLQDHQSNMQLSAAFGLYFVRLPIAETAHILVANALRVSWEHVLPAGECSYILSNPPFVGISLRSADQTSDLQTVWGTGYHGSLDYVTGWYRKAIEYVGRGSTRAAFVSTNSICQGEQVAPLWSPVLGTGFHIDFAHRTFAWTSEASGKAVVHVIIVGFSRTTGEVKRIFDYPDLLGEPIISIASNISPYLLDAPDVIVRPRTNPLAPDLTEINYGNKPTDDGNLIVEPADYESVISDPIAAKYVRRYVGAREMLHGLPRWCLWLADAPPGDIKNSPVLAARIAAVRSFRLESNAASTREAARTPGRFRQIAQPSVPFICIAAHSSEQRDYFPVQLFGPQVVSSNANFITADPSGLQFAVLSSSMFMAWLKAVGGRIKSDLRFNKLLVWNTFPLRKLSSTERGALIAAGAAILAVRSKHPGSTLAELYDPIATPPDLVRAHSQLDRIVDRIIAGRRPVRTTAARQAILLERYLEQIENPLLPSAGSR